MGRQTIYNAEIAETIVDRMSAGESLRSICRAAGFPSEATIRGWATSDTGGFASQYARAREAQAHALAEELLEIADDGSNDWMRSNAPNNPGWEANGEHIARSRLRLDARKWLTSKILPKVYGEKQAIEHVVNLSAARSDDAALLAIALSGGGSSAAQADGQDESGGVGG